MTTVDIPLALAWRWRCEIEGTIFSGSDLRVLDSQRESLVPLRHGVHKKAVVRNSLRHTCGARVTPIAPVSV